MTTATDRKIEAQLHSINLRLDELDKARTKIDGDLSSLRPGEVSDAIESIDEILRGIVAFLRIVAQS